MGEIFTLLFFFPGVIRDCGLAVDLWPLDWEFERLVQFINVAVGTGNGHYDRLGVRKGALWGIIRFMTVANPDDTGGAHEWESLMWGR
ncbi:hypothetical protein AMTR_s00069p00112380 [Amborella trichopoda]|uniref:Uncharacterized protein n=1 Tax=Amborella trichopoda TaxID=13333 RepID=U5D142_AMBTC|nr:hypothetical protein AMTR_s00069p00112380 [Amborella trichopoda]